MGKLQFKRVSQAVEEHAFDCGMKSVNEYVRDSYYPTITQQAYAYSIIAANRIVGYYQVMFREIELEGFPDDISEYYDCKLKDGKISAVHIRFIAVDEKFQRHKIGTSTLQTIIKDIEEMSEKWPVRVVTTDARIDLIDWYEKQGFVRMQKNTIGQDGVTIAMYFDCMKYSDELQEYVENRF